MPIHCYRKDDNKLVWVKTDTRANADRMTAGYVRPCVSALTLLTLYQRKYLVSSFSATRCYYERTESREAARLNVNVCRWVTRAQRGEEW